MRRRSVGSWPGGLWRTSGLWAIGLATAGLLAQGCSGPDQPPGDDDSTTVIPGGESPTPATTPAGTTPPDTSTPGATATPASTETPAPTTPPGQTPTAPPATPGPTETPPAGTGTPAPEQPVLTLSSSAIDFGDVNLGESSKAELTLSNDGMAVLSLDLSFLDDGDGSFSFSQDTVLPSSLAIGASATIGITFTPKIEGPESGTLAIDSNDPANPVTMVPLSGNAQLPPPGDLDGDGFTAAQGDCDDKDAAIYPGAPETCDSKDNDCNGRIDEAGQSTFYADTDLDGFGDASKSTIGCNAPAGYVANPSAPDRFDCDDTDGTVYPGAPEQCDGQDNNCDGQIDEGVQSTFYQDADSDGYGNNSATTQACTAPSGYVNNKTDCDDSAASIHPFATETCNGIDDNCDSQIDEGVQSTFYADTDQDGYGNSSSTQQACTTPSGYVSDSSDCDDTKASIYPGATESCNGADDDCDGQIDEGVQSTFYADTDKDGYGNGSSSLQSCTAPSGYVADPGVPAQLDCDDSKASVHPGATEVCDTLDNDCDGAVDEDAADASTFYQDSDADGYGNPRVSVKSCSKPAGYVTNGKDCNDADPSINPGASETPPADGIDQNCDGIDAQTPDLNGDGYPDLVVANYYNGGYSQNSQIYYSGQEGIDLVNPTDLPTYGARTSCTADFNKDGYQDVVFVNQYNDSSYAVNSRLYFGTANGISKTKYVELPTLGALDCDAADYNNDGYIDLAFANQRNDSTYVTTSYVYFNSPTGFALANRVSLDTVGAYAVTSADLNKDGYLDLVFSDYYDGVNYALNSYIYPGSKTGFSKATRIELPTLGCYLKAAIGDVNADGIPDLVMANYYSGSSYATNSYIYLGPAYDTTSRVSLPTEGASGVAIRDFDKDGFTDIVLSGYYDGDYYANTYVYFGSSRGFSSTNRQPLPAYGVYDLDLADLNSDGYVDLILASHYDGDYTTSSPVFFGSSTGFSTSNTFSVPTYGPESVAARDVDQDGYIDLVEGSYYNGSSYASTAYVYWNSSRGITQSTRSDLAATGPVDVNVVDLNGDKYPEIIYAAHYSTATGYSTSSPIYWGSASGYSAKNVTLLPTLGAYHSCVADLNGDGYPEVVFANHYNGSAYSTDSYVYWGSASGYSAKARTDLPTLGALYCLITDVNGDQDPDIVFANYYNGSSYAINSYAYLNVGGTFTKTDRIDLPTLGAYTVASADLDGNGYPELVFGNYYNGSSYTAGSYLYYGDSTGYPLAKRITLASSGPVAPAILEDLNKDGRIDIIMPGYYDGDESVNTYVYYGSVTGYSEQNRTTLTANRTYDLKVADVDNDGNKDIVMATYYDGDESDNCYVFFGSSQGTYSQGNVQLLPTNRAIRLAISDLDQDGFLDLVFATHYDGDYTTSSYVYYGSATGYSVSRRTSLDTYGAYDVEVADLDRDGLDDVVFANYYGGSSYDISSSIYWNSLRGLANSNRTPIPTLGNQNLVVVGGE